jgi:hypothetical protein
VTQNQSSGSPSAKENEAKVKIKSMRRRMFSILSATIVIIGIASLFLTAKFASGAFESAYFMGASVGIINGGIGFLTVEKFIDKSNIVFLQGVFLGMGIRMLLLLGVFILLIKVFGFHIIGLVTGLLIFYFTMTIFEVIFLNKRIEIKKSAKA